MEMKSVSRYLNKIDGVILEIIGKYIGISDLENFHKYLLEKGQSEFIEDRVALSKVLSQIISTKENYYQFAEENKNTMYSFEKINTSLVKSMWYRAWTWGLTINCYNINGCKSEKKFEKTRHVKNNDKTKKCILRGHKISWQNSI